MTMHADIEVPRIWSALPGVAEEFLSAVAAADAKEWRAARDDDDEKPWYGLPDAFGVANLPIEGIILPRRSAFLAWFGVKHTGVEELAAAAEHLRTLRPRVVRMAVNSPGGTAVGLSVAADAIRELAKVARVEARVTSMAASAAYFLASQATSIEAARDSLVGSIGTYQVVVDASDALDREGIKVHVVRSAPHKGVGTFGAPIDEAQLAQLQATVDALAAEFVGAVARGRKMKPKDVPATGAAFLGAEAQTLGLVDKLMEAGVKAEQIKAVAEALGATAETAEALVEAAKATARERDEARAAYKVAAEQANAFEATAKANRAALVDARIESLAAAGARVGSPIAKENLDAVRALYEAGQDAVAEKLASAYVELSRASAQAGGTPQPKPRQDTPKPSADAVTEERAAKIAELIVGAAKG